ncbi:olfactory receptor 4B13-like [Alosa pseudoharengus]|uniref:olfactory receptor 4B13-like n=1 Tax=Alosa pseudoharengus TaxID=34774 RepID=UPI003F8AA809
MENKSSFTSFIFINYEPMDEHKYLYFTIFLLTYIVTILLNTCLLTIVYKKRTLHEPMYIFISNLAFNAIYGSTSLWPHIMTKLSTQSYTISLVNCFIQIFCIHTYVIVELMILAIMGYDRYAAICTPLHYHTKMSPRKVKILIAVAWLFPFCSFAMYLSLTIRQTFCDNVIHKTHCLNYDVLKLSCHDTSVQNIIGLFLAVVYVAPQFCVIFFSYVQILRICLHASKECQNKALQTCIPHLLTFINYVVGVIFELTQMRMKATQIPYGMSVFMSIFCLVLSPLLNPVIYGSTALKVYIHQFLQRRKLSPFIELSF